MKVFSRRAIPLVLAAVVLLPAAATAQPAESATVTMASDQGDYIGQGLSYSYSTETEPPAIISTETDGKFVTVSVSGTNGDWWYLNFDAPGDRPLVPGTYADAIRYPFNGAGAGLSVYGNGRGCNQLTGSFTVTEAVYAGPDSSYLQRLEASFEQHCEGAEPALRGQVSIVNSAPPPPLELGFEVAEDGTFSRLNGRATVHGTVTCTEPASVTVSGTVTQVKRRIIINGPFSARIDCTPGAPVDWQAVAAPTGTTPFQRGNAEVEATAVALDPNFGVNVEVDRTQVVKLSRA
jgi:hypothetical protein